MKISFALFCLAVGIAAANAAVNTTKCNKCLEDSFGECGNEFQNCTDPATDSCFSAAGRYKLKNGSEVIFPGVARGCISCPNNVTGCANFKVWFDALPDNWTLVACDMMCCKGDECNNQTVAYPDAPTMGPTGSTSTGTEKPTDHATRHFPMAVILAIVAIVAALLFN